MQMFVKHHRRVSCSRNEKDENQNGATSKREIRKKIAELHGRLDVSSVTLDGLTLTQDDINIDSDDLANKIYYSIACC